MATQQEKALLAQAKVDALKAKAERKKVFEEKSKIQRLINQNEKTRIRQMLTDLLRMNQKDREEFLKAANEIF